MSDNFNKPFDFNSSIEYSDGSIVSKKINTSKGGNISLFAFDKGEELSEHTAPFDALVQVIDGSASVLIDGISYQLEKGKSIIMPANIPHALKAKDRFKMILTMIKNS